MEGENKKITMNIPVNDYKELQKMAKTESRTVSGLIRKVIKDKIK